MSEVKAKFIANQDIAKESIRRLKSWMDSTPKVPLNNSGKVNKSSICRLLVIGYSTIGSNKDLKALFNELETRVSGGELLPDEPEKTGSTLRVKELEGQLMAVQKELVKAQAELELLKEGMTCDEFLIATMRAVR